MDQVHLTTTTLGVSRFGNDGPVVVLAGGTGMPPIAWEVCGFVELLVAAGFQVVTYSARGVAPSDAPPAPYSIEEMTGDLAELIELLQIEPCTVVGYSLGGFQAELLARTRPDLVRSVVLLASAGPLTDIVDVVITAEGELLGRLGQIPSSFLVLEGLLSDLPTQLVLDDPEQVALWRELLAVQPDVWASSEGERGQWHAARSWTRDEHRMDQLAWIEVPVLAAAFELDVKFPPRGARLVASLIPHGQVVEIAGASHGGLLTHTQETFDALLPFLLASHEGGEVPQ